MSSVVTKKPNKRKGADAVPNSETVSISDDDGGRGTVQLKREVGLIGGVAVIVGSMIGSGIFISPKGILMGANSVGMSLVIWVLCAVISFLSALCYIELGCLLPRAGGTYQYVLYTYGDLAGFLVSWALTVILTPSDNALLAITIGTYVADYSIAGDCAFPQESVQLFAIVTIMLVVFVNCLSVRASSRLMIIFSSAKVAALIVIILTGLVNIFQGGTQYLHPSVSFAGTTTNIFGYGAALYYGMWPYGGWQNINNLMEEMKTPERNLPLAMYIAIPIVTVVYLLTNVAYFTTLSPHEVLVSSAVALTFAERNLGVMYWLIPLGVCISIIGSLLISLLSDTRLAFAASREGHMLPILSMLSVKRLTPIPAVILQGAIAVVLVLIGNFHSIIMYSGIVRWIMLGSSFMAVLFLRRKFPDKHRPFKVNVLVPIIATLASVFMVLLPVISEPAMEYLYGLVLIAAGLLMYVVFVHWQIQRHIPFIHNLTLFFQKLLFVCPSRY